MSGASVFLESHGGISRDITRSTTRIIRDGRGDITVEPHPPLQSLQNLTCLALITVDDWRVSFEAQVDGFTIVPPGAESLPGYYTIKLPASTSEHRQSTILRPGDCIRLHDEFESTLRVEDVKVDSSIPPTNNETHEVAETQQQPSDGTIRRTRKPITKRTAVQVEQSMQGSNTLRSSTPAQTTQQSMMVAETPATYRKAPFTAINAKDNELQKPTDPQDIVSTNVSTPTAVKDSFAERPKNRTPREQSVPSLELGSFTPGDHTSIQVNDVEGEDETTASERESDAVEEQERENAKFSPAPKSVSTNQSLRATTPPDGSNALEESSSDPLQAADVTMAEPSSNAEEEVPNVRPTRTRRVKPEPQVRIPVSRNSKKRASPQHSEQDRPTKKKKKAQEIDESEESLASSIRIRIDGTPSQPIEPFREESTAARSQSLQRSMSSSINVMSPYIAKAARVAFSNTKVTEREGSLTFLRKSGVKIVEKVTEKGCDIVCIGSINGTYVKSAKLLLGLALGKTIASDSWVLNSRKAGKLLDPSQYPPLNAPSEWGWGDDETQASNILNVDRSELFKGKCFFFTSATRKEYGSGFSDIEKIVQACGAKVMAKSAREYKHGDNNIIVATDHDLEAMSLTGADKDGEYRQCYSKELISMSVLRGSLDLENEDFLIQPSSSQSKKSKKPAARKGRSG
ncbi:BRCT domain-containing protein [Lasiodiplodia theobromae]|uniref:BRCT domain-containing protein n=1 Tax=Lasiodiplodia theobromae TaxID=45133 RepID=UPI0015C3E407|nr:BRCT domain-containing protein [Lasiodiplodia theobromae]KAF4544776.1 BRCT domain-containing protein [Lasiodiplodia theobromae]